MSDPDPMPEVPVLEHALLQVKPGSEAEFRAAFSRAKEIISGMSGFRWLSLSQCMEDPDTFLLLVSWDTLRDHTEGFRGSAEYRQWKAMLHHFYDPFPTVEHFRRVDRA